MRTWTGSLERQVSKWDEAEAQWLVMRYDDNCV